MKLYTEEQVRQAWNVAYIDALAIDNEDYKPKFYDDFINELTPIELPTDEEIDMKIEDSSYSLEFDAGFISGAKWMRDKILNK